MSLQEKYLKIDQGIIINYFENDCILNLLFQF